uniref:Solute carrier organic anion transporter family member n=1 Tax=Paramormyrops kingsleyae TaxID=1676925 RepID=A0A3B3S528_9TELE|nr:solute carrier organic anion transporter family member 1C1-like isoform X1 [Paramormyrops kingsleyae]
MVAVHIKWSKLLELISGATSFDQPPSPSHSSLGNSVCSRSPPQGMMTVNGRPEDPTVMADSMKKPESASGPKCCTPNLKMFIGVLALGYFSKSLSASYMKSTITQIERRFEIPSSTVGIIDCSFEIGNLLVIVVVSYFGAKFHRPKIIGTGSFLMALGTITMALPHFLMERYNYESMAKSSQVALPGNDSGTSPCSASPQNVQQQLPSGCDNASEDGSRMWIIVLLGNMLRGIGEATITPLGASFIDDYARPENSAFYIGCLHTIALIGPMFGYSLSSLSARLYVDIGFVNVDSVTITAQDSRWVGAWWLGFLVAGTFNLVTSIPFWFLPRELPEDGQVMLHSSTKPSRDKHKPNIMEIAKGFLPSLKSLLTSKIYILYLVTSIMMFNGLVIILTYTPKYFEQQFGQSASTANMFLGVATMPAVCLGIFFSGIIMKRFKLDMVGAAKVAFWTSIGGFLCTMPYFALSCKNTDVAGLTVPYPGAESSIMSGTAVLSSCNAACKCPENQWDPICGPDGITYVSPCFAGCTSTSGSGRNMTFHGCSCVLSTGASVTDAPVVLGQCPREDKCSRMFYFYLALQSLSFFIYSLGSVPLFIICLRSVEPELKSLSTGILMLVLRVLGGIPAPIYFGALIDSTCLKWGSRKCGGRGSCRVYNIQTFRFLFLGMISCLRMCGYVLLWVTIIQMKKKAERQKHKCPAEDEELELKRKLNAQTNLNTEDDIQHSESLA